VVRDLPSKPPSGFDKKTQAGDVAGVLDDLKIDHAALVTHDIATWLAMRSPRNSLNASHV
jgi:hypothetical protein